MGYTYYETYNNTQKLRKDVKKMKKRLFYVAVLLEADFSWSPDSV